MTLPNRASRAERARWVVAAAILLFGVATVDVESKKWLLIGLCAYALPLLFQALRPKWLAIASIWLGGFLIAQTVVSRFSPEGNFKTLPPRLNTVVDVRGGIPGIAGPQRVTTDGLGFRVTRRVDYGRDDTIRIFAIGASTTAQVYLDDRRTWTHLLQEQLAESLGAVVEVVNTGVSGLRIQHHLATLERVLGLNPDAVILLAGVNDWNWDIKSAFREYEPVGTGARQENLWLLKNTLLVRHARRMKYARRRAGPDSPAVRVTRGEYYTPMRGSLARSRAMTYRPDAVSEVYARGLSAFEAACERAGVPCLLVTQPTGYRPEAPAEYRTGMWMTPPHQTYTLDFESMVHISGLYNRYLASFAGGKGAMLCDPAPEMTPSYAHFYDDCHFNELGARRFAELIFPCVLSFLEVVSEQKSVVHAAD